MEGLEISEVSWKKVLENNLELRYDSDFFRKDFLQTESYLKSINHDRLINQISDLKSFGAYSLTNYVRFVEKGIPFIRCLNIKNGVVSFDDVLQIDLESNSLLWKSEVKPRMVLVTMSGTVGNATVALENWKYPMNSNQDIAKIETRNLNPFFLATFLNSRFGLLQMHRLQAGAIQQHLYLSQIEKLLIPKLSNDFQNQIESTVKLANQKREESHSLYQAAERALLERLEVPKIGGGG